VEYRDALGEGGWSKLADVLARATNRTEILLDTSFQSNRFYRVSIPQ
jgi:hypothetical protein